MALGFFFPSITGIEAQAKAMETIGMNIANMRTTGYKSGETMFQTLLGSTPSIKNNSSGIAGHTADIHGVNTYNRTHINTQGEIYSSQGAYDVAINRNNAFFLVKNSNGDPLYTRAGDFTTKTENGITYLTTPTGEKVQGFQGEGGSFAGSPSDIILDFQKKVPSIPSSKVTIGANVPATGVDNSSYGINIIGPNNDGQNMSMLFTKVQGKVDTWEATFTIADGTVITNPVEVIFGQNGKILSPENFDINVAWSDGSQNNVTIDISKMTQYAGNSAITYLEQDGRRSGDFLGSFIDADGVLKSKYSNGQILDNAKIALVGFTAPENLTPISSTLFFAGHETGSEHFVLGPEIDGKGMLASNALESSTVNVEKEFSAMIITQRVYSLNSQTFTAMNDLIKTAVDLKA